LPERAPRGPRPRTEQSGCEAVEGLVDLYLNLRLFPLGLLCQGLGCPLSHCLFLPSDRNLDRLRCLHRLVVARAGLADSLLEREFLPENASSEVAVAFRDRHLSLAFELAYLLLLLIEQGLEVVLLGYGGDGPLAVGGEVLAHLPRRFLQEHLGVFELVELAEEQRLQVAP